MCGLFYPSDPGGTRKAVDALLDQADGSRSTDPVRGLVVPHAGYQYSGLTAANGFARIRGMEFKTVVIVAPSHREYFDAVSVFPGDGYETPLGVAQVDRGAREKLLHCCPHAVASDAGHGAEHAIEVELPFLQTVLPTFRILPVVMGDQRRDYCFALGSALAELLDEDMLLVASSDLSHYHPSPIADSLDGIAIGDVRDCDPEALMSDLETDVTEACGGGPIVAVMKALRERGIRHMTVLHHCNSGDITGERQSVVGYLAAAAYSAGQPPL